MGMHRRWKTLGEELGKQMKFCGLLLAQENSLERFSVGTKVCHQEATAHN